MDNISAVHLILQAVRSSFDKSFLFFLLLAIASGLGCWYIKGADDVTQSVMEDAEMFGSLLPKLAAAAVISALIPLLLPRSVVARWLGENSGFRGVVVASAAGSVMPGGPITSFPLVAALEAAGTGRQTLIAFVTAWSVLGVQRILVWELPLMGHEFVLVRVLVSLPLPLAAAAFVLLAIRLGNGKSRDTPEGVQ